MQNYLHKKTDDDRSSNEIILSQKLTSKLTELNLKRIQKQTDKNVASSKTMDLSSAQINSIQNNKVLFVCVSGIPPFQNEFTHLNLPGQTINIILPGFELDLNDDELRKRAIQCDLNTLSHEINQKIQKYPKDFALVFVYHSFGTFITAYYFKNFYEQQKHRIKGIIQLGGAPIRAYKQIESGIQASSKFTRQFIEENIDFIFEKFTQIQAKLKTESSNISTLSINSKFSLMGLLLCYKTQGIHEIFDMLRKMPKVLKLSVYGERDTLFERKNLDQKAIFYLYNQKATLDKQYVNKLAQKYSKIHGQVPSNIQEKFIYKLEKGKHSLHMQKQLIPLIREIINDYLQIIF